MKIKSLHIYPIKGLGAIDISSSQVLDRGLQYDRRWMLVDAEGKFISQRTDPRLALFRCTLTDQILVDYQGDSIQIDLENHSEKHIEVSVWESHLYAYEVDPQISKWFSAHLGFTCKLVKMVDEFERTKTLIKGPPSTKLSFADGYPYLIIGTASFKYLSDKMGKDVASNRFRPNIIVDTNVPHIEDTWDVISIGEARFQIIKKCARCPVINIDQMSAETNKETLKMLATYRREANKVNFGASAICITEGTIDVGDKVLQ